MHCSCCGAPIDPEFVSKGVCRYCGVGVSQVEIPGVEHGVAEIFKALGLPGGAAVAVAGQPATVTGASSFVVDGKAYARLEDMPPDVRKRVEEKMAKLAALGFGLPQP